MQQDSAIEASLEQLESCLLALGEALRGHRPDAVEAQAADLQRALGTALEPLRRGARDGRPSPPLRQRLALASGLVAAQRESLARAGAAVDRAIDVLLPRPSPRVAYSAAGLSERQPHGGLLRA